jgi:hypothetical protein
MDASNFSALGILGAFAGLSLLVMGFVSLFVMLAVRSTS